MSCWILDEAPYEEVRDSLQDVATVNRYLSGYRVLLHHVKPFLKAHKSRSSVYAAGRGHWVCRSTDSSGQTGAPVASADSYYCH